MRASIAVAGGRRARSGPGHGPSALVLWVVVATFVAACTGAAVAPPRATKEPAKTPKPTKVAPAPTTSPVAHVTPNATSATPFVQPTPTPDPFRQHETPDNGVASMPFITPNGVNCRILFGDPGPGHWVKVAPRVALPSRSTVCLYGFDGSTPIGLSVTGADGLTDPLTIDVIPGGDVRASLDRVPGNAEGTAIIHARQGDATADASTDVVRASEPAGLAVPAVIHVNETVAIWFGGLKPQQSVPVYLYRSANGWEYAARLPDVHVSEDGSASLSLTPHSGDEGGYLVFIDALGRNRSPRVTVVP
jgi:hypothetical protein